MVNLYIVTYATHSEGMFEKLINNKFNKEIDIIGWGTKFNNYIDKIKHLNDFILDKNNSDIVIYLDGFDSLINKNFDNRKLINIFLQYNTNILISEDPSNMLLIDNKEIGDKIYSYNFGQYKNNEKPNMGMFMGYVKDLKKLAKCIISQNITDDQMALYNCFGDNIKIDTKHKIFLNTKHSYYKENDKKIEAIFVSFPFGNTDTDYDTKRYKRFFLKEKKYHLLLLLFLIIIMIIFTTIYLNKNNIYNILKKLR